MLMAYEYAPPHRRGLYASLPQVGLSIGLCADRAGRARVYKWGSLLCGLSVYPAFWLIKSQPGNTLLIWLAIVIPFGIFYAMVYGPEASLFADLFDASVRYTGISFVYQFSGVFASGLTPIIATALWKMSGGKWWTVCADVLFSALVSAYSARAMDRARGQRESQRESPREQQAVSAP